ncbi:MAG: type IV pilus twitching motility protein PilT [Gemmatimonadetes bacterium]|nr:MAG: type IV pilus twitching motility protein PilT [Gemmatimonadota bacterium]
MHIDELLAFSKESGASDLHLSTGSTPMVRINGTMRKLNLPVNLENGKLKDMIYEILKGDQKEKLERDFEIDFSYALPNVARFRVNVFHQILGIGAVFRTIPEEIKGFEELGIPLVLRDLALKDRGLVLLTGPTGSGKTTTLATMINHINENRQCHIITIEDPVEFFHSSKNSLINQRELGATTHSFANALRAALREDPDVILVGEMRDRETVQLALTASETGHLVLSTVHTSGAPKTINRIIDIFPSEQQPQIRSMLSESLEGVINQKLLPTKDGKGRVVGAEVMIATPAVRNLIRENKIYEIPSVIQSSSHVGMQTLDDDLRRLVVEGKINKADAAKVADDPEWFMR